MKILEESQVSQMLVAAQGSRMEALLHLAVATGMRQMEILGLKWSDLDWIRQTLKVERQKEERKVAGNSWQEYGLIFTSKVGTPIHYRNLLRDFQLLLQKAGLPRIRFHDLRHTAASIMLNHGIPVIVVSRRLGHAKPSITLDVYGHLMPSMQAEAAQKIDDLITPVEINSLDQLHTTAHDLHTHKAP